MGFAAQDPRFALFDHVPLGVCVLSADLTVRFWNSCLESWTGIARHEILGTDLSERFQHLREPLYYQRLKMIFEGGPPTVFSSQLHRHLIHAPLPDGQLRIQHTVVTAIAADEHRFDALFSIQDVTDLTRRLEDHRALRHQMLREVRERRKAEEERRRLEAKIQYAQKLESLGILAGGIAHDFNNLLVGILGNADLALAKAPPGAMHRQFLEAISSSAQRAAALSNQMLAFSGKGKFVTTAIDLAELVRDVVRLLEMSLPDRAKIRLDLPSTTLPTVADPTQIRQLLMSLITNASDAVEGRGEIVISGGAMECDSAYLSASPLVVDLPEGPYVYLDVTDDGPGMSQETIEKIFDPFFTTKFAGRGLGLAAALGIVRGHGGTFRVDSQLGGGTTFKVLLPQAEELVRSQAVEPATTDLRGDGLVLVIDDEVAVRDVVRGVLEDRGLRVLTAATGDEGLEIFSRQVDAVSAVLLDMTMPGLSGQETLRELRRLAAEVPVILSSGFSEDVVRDHFKDPTISGFLQKPYPSADLLAMVQSALGEERRSR